MRRKKKKAFVITKIKPKLVFLPPKKFWGKKITGVILLVLGSVILTFTIFWIFGQTYFTKECPSVSKPSSFPEKPKLLFLPNLDLNLALIEAKAVANQWQLPEKEAAFMLKNDYFSESGNLVIFGKNSPEILGKLSSIKKGDEIYLFGERQYQKFSVAETGSISADDGAIFAETSEKTLTIFSTADFLEGKRFVVKAIKK